MNPRRIDEALLRRDYPLPSVPEDSGKEDRGRLLVIAGSRELAGAALLAGLSALRVGAGKLQIATAQSIAPMMAVATPEARVIGYPETETGCIEDAGIRPLIRWADGAQAVSIGCGMQNGPPLERLLQALLEADSEAPLILDAAILDCLVPLEPLVKACKRDIILLPHRGEMARLLDRGESEIAKDPLAAVQEAAERFGAITLVKGARSFAADPSGRCFQMEGGGVGLATSGSGDVLAGIVGGLCARGAPALNALLWGMWLHAEAGRKLTEKIGRLGFLARELPGELPGLLPD